MQTIPSSRCYMISVSPSDASQVTFCCCTLLDKLHIYIIWALHVCSSCELSNSSHMWIQSHNPDFQIFFSFLFHNISLSFGLYHGCWLNGLSNSLSVWRLYHNEGRILVFYPSGNTLNELSSWLRKQMSSFIFHNALKLRWAVSES